MTVLRDAYTFIIPLVLLALVCAALGWWYAPGFFIGAAVLLLLAGFVAFFFRDPQREVPADSDAIVSPADGRVVVVKPLDARDREFSAREFSAPAATRLCSSGTLVSIFLSVFDVHVNRAPVAGAITRAEYRPGKFIVATAERASVENEQNVVTVENEQVRIVFKQIAGLIARRIVFWKQVGDRVALGERVGLIKFGSRADLILPPNVSVQVRPGDRVKGGISIIGRVQS
jgi:phosphatidylserine decarboxylase